MKNCRYFPARQLLSLTRRWPWKGTKERGQRKPGVSPVLLPEEKEEYEIIFDRTCACRQYLDLFAPGANTPVTEVTGVGIRPGRTELSFVRPIRPVEQGESKGGWPLFI